MNIVITQGCLTGRAVKLICLQFNLEGIGSERAVVQA